MVVRVRRYEAGGWTAHAFTLRGNVRKRQEDRLAVRRCEAGECALLVAVLDGVGGAPRGLETAEACARLLRSAPPRPWKERLAELNHAAFASGGYTTLAGFLGGRQVRRGLIVNVGDSSIYRIGRMVERLGPPAQPRGQPLRTVLGGREAPDVPSLEVTLRAGERLLLCSDGVDGVLALPMWRDALLGEPRPVMRAVAQAVLAAGAPDNATAVLLEGPEGP